MYEYSQVGEKRGTPRFEEGDLLLLLGNALQIKLGLPMAPDEEKAQFRRWFDKDGAELVAGELRKLSQEQIENGEGMETLVEAYQAYQKGRMLH